MSEFSEGMAVGQSLGNNNNNCCHPAVPMMPMYGGYGMGGFGGFGGYGGDGWWILLLLLCGWGNNGWGNNGGGNQMIGYELGRVATTNDVASGFNNSAVLGSLNDLKLGQSQGFAGVQQTLCQGFSGVNQTVMNGFHGVDNAICNLGYQTQNGIHQLSTQLADCCCQTQRAIDGVNYNAERNACNIQNAIYNSTRDIIDSNRCGFDRIENRLVQQEMDRLRAENQDLKFEKSQINQNAFIAANQEAQTATLIRRLGLDCPQPTYLVNPPTPINFPVNSCGRVQFTNGGSCCNAGCGF